MANTGDKGQTCKLSASFTTTTLVYELISVVPLDFEYGAPHSRKYYIVLEMFYLIYLGSSKQYFGVLLPNNGIVSST